MRRQLAAELPLLMRIYPGIRPWDLDRYTFREIGRLIDHATQLLQDGGDDG